MTNEGSDEENWQFIGYNKPLNVIHKALYLAPRLSQTTTAPNKWVWKWVRQQNVTAKS